MAAGLGQGCDSQSGRMAVKMCAAGLASTGPFEGIYGRGKPITGYQFYLRDKSQGRVKVCRA
ncbi:MAG: hypothetical protein GY761_07845 [Hyphomicrobiales bacterium]|nr:hypothetical protein [Hyphomicrobiales bacterium]